MAFCDSAKDKGIGCQMFTSLHALKLGMSLRIDSSGIF
jgi:hypothetical protein